MPRFSRFLAFLLSALLAHPGSAAASVNWLPAGFPSAPESAPALCPRDYLTPDQGKAVLSAALAEFPDLAAWQGYADHVRARIQEGAGLLPWPRRTPLNPIVRDRREYDGYSVENVAFESVPGYFVTGNLFRPLRPTAAFAVVLSTHGHAQRIQKPDDYDHHGRFNPVMQTRCAALARMGAVVFSIDMFGLGDSILEVGQEAHAHPFSMTIQLWNAIRAIDFLLSLEGADRARVAVTGESGGATQVLLLTAVDPRVTLSVPVVMVSAHFFGGCPCESGLPVHRSADHFASNAMIAALAAPRPLLVVSDGKDWTLNVPQVEYPFLQHIYAMYGAEGQVENVHLLAEGHDYGPSKRAALYHFMAARFGLDLAPMQDAQGKVDESKITIERAGPLHVFSEAEPIPGNALRDAAAVERVLRELQHN